MPRSQCDFCCAPEELARNIDTFRPAQLQIGCAQLDTALEANTILQDILIQLQTGGTSGTQYEEGDIVPSVTGTATMWRDVGNVMQPVSAATPLPVNVVAGSTSGTQYTEGDTEPSVIGTAIMWRDGSGDMQPVSGALPLPVTFSGNVTVDQGTSPWIVGGTVAATQSGAWNVGVNNAGGGSAVNIQDGGNIITVDGTVGISGSVTVTGTVAATQSGTWNINNISGTISLPTGAATETTLLVLNGKFPVATILADDMSLPVATRIGAVNLIYDGTNTDLMRSALNGLNSTGTGLVTSQIIAQFDDTSPTTITENQFGNLRMSANRNLYGTIRDAAGNERGANVNASNQLSVSVDAIGTVTVSGTVAATQSGTWNINNISGTISLPTGAATETTLSALNGKFVAAATLADDMALPSTTRVGAVNMLYDGTNNDLMRSALNALNSTGTGLATAQIIAQFDDVAPTSITENQFGNLRMSANRNLYGTIRDAAGNERGANVDSSNQLLVSAAVSAIIPGVGATNLGKAEDAIAGSGDVGVGALCVINNTNASKAADGDYTFRSVDDAGMGRVVGNVANDAADAGDPVKIGYQARQTLPTAVADGDRVNGIADDMGREVVVLNSVRDLEVHQPTTISNTSETTVLTAGGANVFLDVTMIIITNTSATSVRADIRDATAGTIIFSIDVPARGGAVMPFNVPLKQTTANNNWTVQMSASVTDIRILFQAVANK